MIAQLSQSKSIYHGRTSYRAWTNLDATSIAGMRQ